MTTTVRELLRKAIIDNGADGLCNDDCGCSLEDLMPCDGVKLDCVLAVKAGCYRCGDEHDEDTGHECEPGMVPK